jgi:hypothetical protein
MVCFKFDPEYFAAEEFELATWESKFVEQVHFNIETHQNEDLRQLLAKGILPYRDVGDVLRHALRRHLVLLESLGLLRTPVMPRHLNFSIATGSDMTIRKGSGWFGMVDIGQ